MSHVWIAMDDEAYERGGIYAVCRTREGAKTAIEAAVNELDAKQAKAFPDRSPVEFGWHDMDLSSSVMGRYSCYIVERHEVSET